MSDKACEKLVSRMVGNQMGMNLDIWSTKSLTSSEDREAAELISGLKELEDLLKIKEVQSVTVKSDTSSEYDDEGGYYTSRSNSLSMIVEVNGEGYDVSSDGDGVTEIEEVADELEESDPEGAKAIRALAERINEFINEVEYSLITSSDFWEEAGVDEFTVDREAYDGLVKGGQVDWLGLVRETFTTRMGNIKISDLSQPPLRWSDFELAQVKERLKAGMSPDAMDSSGQSALNAAAWHGVDQAAKALLAAGANPSVMDASALTPVVTAAYRGRLEILQEIAAAGGEISGPAHAPTGLFVIQELDPKSGVAVMEALLESGLDLHAPMPDGGNLAEHVERYTDKEEYVRFVRSAIMSDLLAQAMDGHAPAVKLSKSSMPAL